MFTRQLQLNQSWEVNIVSTCSNDMINNLVTRLFLPCERTLLISSHNKLWELYEQANLVNWISVPWMAASCVFGVNTCQCWITNNDKVKSPRAATLFGNSYLAIIAGSDFLRGFGRLQRATDQCWGLIAPSRPNIDRRSLTEQSLCAIIDYRLCLAGPSVLEIKEECHVFWQRVVFQRLARQ